MATERSPASSALARGYAAVVPMFNEEANVERCVRAVAASICRTEPRGTLLIVDDGSTDRTRGLLARLKGEYPDMVIIEHGSNRGYGAALVTGAHEAHRLGLGYALYMDADLTTDPKYIPDFVEKMRGDFDVIKATRYSRGGGMLGVPPHRAWISRLGNAVARLLFRLPVADCTNGFRAVKTSLLVRLPLKETAFPVIMEELYYLSAVAKTYAEVPYVLTSRAKGQGVSRFVYRPGVFARYLKYAVLSLLRPPVLGELPDQEKR